VLDAIRQLSDVLDARRLISPHLDPTPLRRYPLLDELVGTLEMLERAPELDTILVPVGGGSGAAGACVVAKAIRPGSR
jgi:threonine dehydratase